ncbi:JDVT-CTERM system glutamic-type intramembrane protease MrtJ [Deferribacteres bacterium DY0037]
MDKKRTSDFNIMLVFILGGLVWFAVRLSYGAFRLPEAKEILIFLLLAPVAEELFFRGVVQDILRRKVASVMLGISLANIITSLCFTLFHIPFWGYMHSALVFIPSIIFGFLYDRTGKLAYSVILHSIYNLNIFIV